MGSIYKITNTVNGKSYIGQTIHDPEKGRIRQHLIGSINGSQLVRHAVKKYGKDVFTFEILHDGIIPEFLDTLEVEAIAKFNTVAPHGYNLTTGGNRGKKPSKEVCQKISEAKKGVTQSPETKAKRSASVKKAFHRKGGHSPESKAKMSAAAKGRKRILPSAETRAKMSDAHKSLPPRCEEHNRKLSESLKKSPRAIEQRHKLHQKLTSPERAPARALFFSLPADMDLKEKRRLLHQKIKGVDPSTINRWVRQWTQNP